MKLPTTFLPDKNLENTTKKLLNYNPTKENPSTLNYFLDFEIERGMKHDWFRFDNGLEVLKRKGYERHMYPWEYFGLIIDYFENKLDKGFEGLCEDMLEATGDWFSIAVQRKGDILTCYINPENLHWDKETQTYSADGKLKYTEKRELQLSGIPAQEWVKLEEFDNEVVQFFYNCKFKDLPQEITESKPEMYFAADNVLWPLARQDSSTNLSPFSLFTRCMWGRASRGIRAKKDKK